MSCRSPGGPPGRCWPAPRRAADARDATVRGRPVRRQLPGRVVGLPARRTAGRLKPCRPQSSRSSDRPRPGSRVLARPGPLAGRRDHQRRLDAAVPGHGHRHGQAAAGGAGRRAPSSARHLGRHQVGERLGVPATRAGGHRRDPLPRPGSPPGRGSGLYVRAALDNLTFPGTDPRLRERLEGELAQLGPAALHARLASLDPAAAAAILPGNGRRIVRALEVVELSGQPFSATLPGLKPSTDRPDRAEPAPAGTGPADR